MRSRQLLAVLVAALVLTALTATLGLVPERIEAYNQLGPRELRVFLVQLGVALPLAVLLWRTTGDRPRPARADPRLWAAVALVGAVVLGGLRGWTQLTDDAHVYIFQAGMLLRGHLVEAASVPVDLLGHQFVVPWPGDPGSWAGCYPLPAAAWTAPGAAVGFPNLLWVLLAPATVLAGTWAARQIAPTADTSLVTLLLATSPALLGLSSTLHTASGVAVLAPLVAGLLAVAWRTPAAARWSLVAAGAALALIVHLRPIEGMIGLLATAAGLGWVGWTAGGRVLLRHAAGIGLGAAPLAAVWLAYNDFITGNPLTVAYELLRYDGLPFYGFGDTAWGPHTLAAGLRKAAAVEVRMGTWGAAWPAGLAFVLGAAAVAARSWAGRGALVLLAAHVLLYLPAPFGEVPSVGVTYSVVQVPLVVLLVGLAAGAAPRLRTVALGLTLLGWLAVLPGELRRMVGEAEAARAPVEFADELVAERGPIVVLHRLFITNPLTSYVHYPPPPRTASPDVIWIDYDALVRDGEERAMERLRQVAGDRPIVQLGWRGAVQDGFVVSDVRLPPPE